ncbi:MAG TPA: mycothiol conjugate amidase Mca [Actinomycetota bacterium]|nr:mycothiol conjugate amidase Mca [Actinomycetota bacterium]
MTTKQRCLLALHAHPDDESSKGAGTMARYAAEGVRVVLVCATDGAEGEILNPRMDQPGIQDRMVELRKAELETACDILGVSAVYHLGYRDSGMPKSEANKHPEAFWNADADEAVGKLVEIIRSERPEVVLSYDESKGYEHPDHIRVHEWGAEAFHAAGDPDRFPDKGPPWAPSKLYYFATFTKNRFQKLNDAAVSEGAESPYSGWLENWDSMGFAEPEVTTQVDVSEYIELRSKALLAHATQIDPDSFWFAVPDELQKRVYPWEDYTLVASSVDVDLPEDDLFAGLDQ